MQLLIHITNHEDSVDAPAIVGGLRRFVKKRKSMTDAMLCHSVKVRVIDQFDVICIDEVTQFL